MSEVRFDDIPGLQALISEEFGPWGPEIEITQDMINKFAELTGDHQWIHVDVERAKKGPFGGPIAHGFLTLSLIPTMRPGAEWKVVGYGNAVNYGADKLRFMSPVPANSKVHARSRLVGAEPKPKGVQITQELAVHVVGNDKPSLLYTMIVLYQPPR